MPIVYGQRFEVDEILKDDKNYTSYNYYYENSGFVTMKAINMCAYDQILAYDNESCLLKNVPFSHYLI